MPSITACGTRRSPASKRPTIHWKVTAAIRSGIAMVRTNARDARNARLLRELSDESLKDIGLDRYQLGDPIWLTQALPYQGERGR